MNRFGISCVMLLALAVSPAAWAAGRHYCSNVRGEVVVSDTPCQSSDPSTTDSAAKARPDLPRAESPLFNDPAQLRDQHVKYMSSRCRHLYESLMEMRNSRWASVTWQQKQNADNNYRAECGEEELAARVRLSKEKWDGSKARFDESRARYEAERARDQADALSRDQCVESRRIILARRARTDMTPGELQDLARFEENIKRRCQPALMGQ